MAHSDSLRELRMVPCLLCGIAALSPIFDSLVIKELLHVLGKKYQITWVLILFYHKPCDVDKGPNHFVLLLSLGLGVLDKN